MIFNLTVVANEKSTELRLAKQLEHALTSMVEVRVSLASEFKNPKEWGSIIFIDLDYSNFEGLLNQLDRSQRAVFLVVPESRSDSPEILSALDEELVDDVLVHPLRALEVLSKIRHYQQILLWDEVKALSTSFSEVLERLQDDVKFAERIQKSKFPDRFPDVKGFQVSSRYLVGMKSGGDYFDLAESKSGNQMSIILTDSSSYGLSSALLSVLMRVAMKLTADEVRSCSDTLEKIREEISLTLNEKDRLSIFYAIISRKDYRLRYLNLGSSRAFYAPHESGFTGLKFQEGPITQISDSLSLQENEVILAPKSRLVLVSDGFIEAAGGEAPMIQLLEKFREEQAKDLLNELSFRVKSKGQDLDEMPSQDCTALVFDADPKLMRAV